MASFSFVTVCVGKSYIDYFANLLPEFANLNLPSNTNLYVNTNHVDYASLKLIDSPLRLQLIDFSPILDHYEIPERLYRDNDCIKIRAFLNALPYDSNDFLFYIDGDMKPNHYDKEEFDKVFDQEGFYYELCHEYNSPDDIEDHTIKRVRQIQNLGFDLQFMNTDRDTIIFPIERYWGLKRTFCEREQKFAEEFINLFDLMINNGLRNDLYTECVEMAHCFGKHFEGNKHINMGLTFSETHSIECYTALQS